MDKNMDAGQPPADDDKRPERGQLVHDALASADARCPFGPSFFLGQLAAFVRDRCPKPTEALPAVELHLVTGDVLDVCHIIGVAPRWIALAVWAPEALSSGRMHTVLVPYETIVRVTISPTHERGDRIGFNQAHAPHLSLSPEEALSASSAERPHDEDRNEPSAPM